MAAYTTTMAAYTTTCETRLMTHKLPPLNALKAFEAAARELSFKDAAVELNLTPAAVGYQVRRLEQELGAKLFHRLNRALVLTDAGKAYLPVVQEAFDGLAKGTAALTARESDRLVMVRTTWSLSSKWLVARLENFHKRHPHLMVRVDSTDELADFARDDVDVALQYCKPCRAPLAFRPSVCRTGLSRMQPRLDGRGPAAPGRVGPSPSHLVARRR